MVFFDLCVNFFWVGIWFSGNCFQNFYFNIVVKFDVGIMVSYVGCNGDGVKFIGFCNDFGFLFVLMCVQNIMFNVFFGQ